jgi:hypothetical protein
MARFLLSCPSYPHTFAITSRPTTQFTTGRPYSPVQTIPEQHIPLRASQQRARPPERPPRRSATPRTCSFIHTNTESTCATIPSESTRAATLGGSPPSGAGTTPLPTRGVSRMSPTSSTGQRSYAVCNSHSPGACPEQHTDIFVQASASRRSTRHGRTSSSAPSSRPTKWPTPFPGERDRRPFAIPQEDMGVECVREGHQ